jgi:hypothetical protein
MMVIVVMFAPNRPILTIPSSNASLVIQIAIFASQRQWIIALVAKELWF